MILKLLPGVHLYGRWFALPQHTQYKILVNKGLVSTCEDSDLIVFNQHFKWTTSYVNIITTPNHIVWKRLFSVFTLIN